MRGDLIMAHRIDQLHHVPASEVSERVAILSADPRTISVSITPDGDGTFTIVQILSLPAVGEGGNVATI
jgi:hypothetical protein